MPKLIPTAWLATEARAPPAITPAAPSKNSAILASSAGAYIATAIATKATTSFLKKLCFFFLGLGGGGASGIVGFTSPIALPASYTPKVWLLLWMFATLFGTVNT